MWRLLLNFIKKELVNESEKDRCIFCILVILCSALFGNAASAEGALEGATLTSDLYYVTQTGFTALPTTMPNKTQPHSGVNVGITVGATVLCGGVCALVILKKKMRR